MDEKEILKYIRRQVAEYCQQFVAFLDCPGTKDGKEVILQKKVQGRLPFGPENEFGICVYILMDSQNKVLTIRNSTDIFFDAVFNTKDESTKLHVHRILDSYYYTLARNNAISQICKWYKPKEDDFKIDLESLSDKVLCERIRGYRKMHIERIAHAILNKAKDDRALNEDLKDKGLTAVRSFHDRYLDYLEELYFEVFGEAP